MGVNRAITIGIIADPHVVVPSPPQPGGGSVARHSFFEVVNEQGHIDPLVDDHHHPWRDLQLLAARNFDLDTAVKVDALLCAGDLGFQGAVPSIQAAWTLLKEFGEHLDVEVLAAATGNHDVLSRSQAVNVGKNPVRGMAASVGLFEPLKMLEPAYPVLVRRPAYGASARQLRSAYFGEGAVLYQTDVYRLLVINSCADHGHDSYEFERGNLSESTLIAIKTDLDALGPEDKINLALVHHPPSPDSAMGSPSADHMHRGDLLLSALQDSGQEWLLIHGHKHRSSIAYAGGGQNVTVFSAASLAMKLHQQAAGARNQFYLLQVEQDSSTGRLQGRVRCWDWYPSFGWSFAQVRDGGICDKGGFGNRDTTRDLASRIASHVNGKLPMKWEQILQGIPELAYVPSDELLRVQTRLRSVHGLSLEQDSNKHWSEVARSA